MASLLSPQGCAQLPLKPADDASTLLADVVVG
jgi:hypothetical protein